MGAVILEERHMVSTLLFLHGNSGCTKTELYRAVSSNPRMPEKLNLLESAGLLTQRSRDGSNAVRISLTDLGHEVASILAEIDELMSRHKP